MSSWRAIGTFNVDLIGQDYIVKDYSEKQFRNSEITGDKKQDNFVWGNINQFRPLTRKDHFVLYLIIERTSHGRIVTYARNVFPKCLFVLSPILSNPTFRK